MKHALKLLLWRPDPEARARAWYNGTLEAYRDAEAARDALLNRLAKIVIAICAVILMVGMAQAHPERPKKPPACTELHRPCPAIPPSNLV